MSVIVSLPLKIQIWSFHQPLFSLLAPDLMVLLMVAWIKILVTHQPSVIILFCRIKVKSYILNS